MDVSRSAFSLVVHKKGNVSELDIDDLLEFYRAKKSIVIDRTRFAELVEAARSQYMKSETALYICTDKPCLKKTHINPSDQSIDTLRKQLNCLVEITGCHWQCEDAPVVTVKHRERSQSFLKCDSAEQWNAVSRFIWALGQSRIESSHAPDAGATPALPGVT